MTDWEILAKLAEKAGGTASLARRLSVTRQSIYNWRSDGVPKPYRFAVAALAEEYGVGLPEGYAALAPAEPIAGAA